LSIFGKHDIYFADLTLELVSLLVLATACPPTLWSLLKSCRSRIPFSILRSDAPNKAIATPRTITGNEVVAAVAVVIFVVY